ncbi:hypothetical protein K439DRAFT_1659610 [Ramaria rubella]|nr:hypothetical protein K439DRAFT_1659610 [Ramaria rubella]
MNLQQLYFMIQGFAALYFVAVIIPSVSIEVYQPRSNAKPTSYTPDPSTPSPTVTATVNSLTSPGEIPVALETVVPKGHDEIIQSPTPITSVVPFLDPPHITLLPPTPESKQTSPESHGSEDILNKHDFLTLSNSICLLAFAIFIGTVGTGGTRRFARVLYQQRRPKARDASWRRKVIPDSNIGDKPVREEVSEEASISQRDVFAVYNRLRENEILNQFAVPSVRTAVPTRTLGETGDGMIDGGLNGIEGPFFKNSERAAPHDLVANPTAHAGSGSAIQMANGTNMQRNHKASDLKPESVTTGSHRAKIAKFRPLSGIPIKSGSVPAHTVIPSNHKENERTSKPIRTVFSDAPKASANHEGYNEYLEYLEHRPDDEFKHTRKIYRDVKVSRSAPSQPLIGPKSFRKPVPTSDRELMQNAVTVASDAKKDAYLRRAELDNAEIDDAFVRLFSQVTRLQNLQKAVDSSNSKQEKTKHTGHADFVEPVFNRSEILAESTLKATKFLTASVATPKLLKRKPVPALYEAEPECSLTFVETNVVYPALLSKPDPLSVLPKNAGRHEGSEELPVFDLAEIRGESSIPKLATLAVSQSSLGSDSLPRAELHQLLKRSEEAHSSHILFGGDLFASLIPTADFHTDSEDETENSSDGMPSPDTLDLLSNVAVKHDSEDLGAEGMPLVDLFGSSTSSVAPVLLPAIRRATRQVIDATPDFGVKRPFVTSTPISKPTDRNSSDMLAGAEAEHELLADGPVSADGDCQVWVEQVLGKASHVERLPNGTYQRRLITELLGPPAEAAPIPLVRRKARPRFKVYRDPPSPTDAAVQMPLDPQPKENKAMIRGLMANQRLKENRVRQAIVNGVRILYKDGIKGGAIRAEA